MLPDPGDAQKLQVRSRTTCPSHHTRLRERSMSAVASSTFETPDEKGVSRLPAFAWGVLVYNLGVILWGAFVRATGSGAGCGRHWPLCNGDVVPHAPSTATMIEASHRVTSGIAAFLVLGLVIWTLKVLPKKHPARKSAVLSGV